MFVRNFVKSIIKIKNYFPKHLFVILMTYPDKETLQEKTNFNFNLKNSIFNGRKLLIDLKIQSGEKKSCSPSIGIQRKNAKDG